MAQLETLADARMVFVAGLPGTGKSLVVHQLAHVATTRGGTIHLLQWDVVRPVFEATESGRRHPLADGVTHPVVRKAAGLWVRPALAAWDASHRATGALLVGETPFVGHRFIELARREDDVTETRLADPTTRFVVPVPSREVRAFLESERQRRTAEPVHAREREDAPPHVMRALWRLLIGLAPALGLPPETSPHDGEPAWDPGLYRGAYEALLRHRHADVIPLDTVLPTASQSVYDFAIEPHDVVPTEQEANHFIEEVERRYPDLEVLKREIDRWWDV